jgi:hypothetical protein
VPGEQDTAPIRNASRTALLRMLEHYPGRSRSLAFPARITQRRRWGGPSQ